MEICRVVSEFIEHLPIDSVKNIVFSQGNPDNLASERYGFSMPAPRIVFLLSGEKWYKITGKSSSQDQLITPGDFLYVCPLGLLKPQKLTCYHMISIVYMKNYVRIVSIENSRLKGTPPKTPDCCFHSDYPISSTGKHLLNILNHPQSISKQSLDYILIALLKETGQCFTTQNRTINKSQETFNCVMSYIYENLFNPELTRETTANNFQLNPAYISQLFTKHTQGTFNQFINCERIDMATSLLESTNKPVKEISTLCGFTSPEYFIRVFKKIKNQSPARYRRLVGK